jgi:serine/threonine-protein kinase RsbT
VLDESSTEARIALATEDDIIRARKEARELARSLGFGLVDQSRIATAVSELTRNVIRYATNGRGDVVIHSVASPRGVGIEIVVADDGPGMPNIASAAPDIIASEKGMGLGLPGTRRLMDEMVIDTGPARGTTVTIRKWRR